MAEELGYRECDWSRLSEDEIDRHDEVLDFEPDELRALDLEKESDLVKWAAAQAWADLDDDAAFHETALSIIRSGNNHVAVDYAEICVELLNDAIIEGDWDQASVLLDDIERLVPDDISVRARYEATIMVMRGNRDEGLAMMQDIIDNAGDDAGLVLAVGEDLIACEELERAKEVLAGAEELARAENDHELLEDIADAKSYIVAIESGQID
jgi:fructose-specific component phosphotransferase system IIB-like protein